MVRVHRGFIPHGDVPNSRQVRRQRAQRHRYRLHGGAVRKLVHDRGVCSEQDTALHGRCARVIQIARCSARTDKLPWRRVSKCLLPALSGSRRLSLPVLGSFDWGCHRAGVPRCTPPRDGGEGRYFGGRAAGRGRPCGCISAHASKGTAQDARRGSWLAGTHRHLELAAGRGQDEPRRAPLPAAAFCV